MRVLIADDEAPARERLRQLLASYKEIEVVGEAETGPQVLQLATEAGAGLLFLDIQMPGASGLEIAASLPQPQPAIIFCTAYDQYAVDAFELRAVDYLLKPVSRARLAQALQRVPAFTGSDNSEETLAAHPYLSRVLVRSGSHYVIVPVAQIVTLEAAERLTRVLTSTGETHWIDPPLQVMQARLDPARFFRISRAALVNLAFVQEVYPLPGGAAEIVLEGRSRLEVSRRRLRDLLQALER